MARLTGQRTYCVALVRPDPLFQSLLKHVRPAFFSLIFDLDLVFLLFEDGPDHPYDQLYRAGGARQLKYLARLECIAAYHSIEYMTLV